MKNDLKYIEKERKFHDLKAKIFAEIREADYIWEVPEEIFLLKKKYFRNNYTIVDMGCGPAVSIRKFVNRHKLKNIIYFGVDISGRMLSIARQNIPWGKFIRADMSSVTFPSASTDILLSFGALHHSPNIKKSIRNWAKMLKSGGIVLLREPTYMAFKRGEGESPIEQGIIYEELITSLIQNRLKLKSIIYFSSPFFHFCNRVMIKVGLGKWQKFKPFWYPVMLLDVVLIKLLSRFTKFFNGLAFVCIISKT